MTFERWFFLFIVLSAIMLSIGGVVWAVHTNNFLDGTRGGAIAVAVALGALFGLRDYANKIYEALTQRSAKWEKLEILILFGRNKYENTKQPSRKETKSLEDAHEKIDGLETRIRLQEEGELAKSIYLAIATAFGTIFWGFGDWIAADIAPYWPPSWRVPSPALGAGTWDGHITQPSTRTAKFACFDDSNSILFPFSDGSAEIAPVILEEGLDAVSDWVGRNTDTDAHLIGVIVIGLADKRVLSLRLRQEFGDNQGLAIARARVAARGIERKLLLPYSAIMTIYAGPSVFGKTPSSEEMAGDRAVRVCGLWG